MAQEIWGEIKETIKQTVGVNNFNTWIAPLNFCEIENGVAVFEVPTNFIGNYVAQNFSDVILFQLSALFGDVRRLRFDVSVSTQTAPTNTRKRAEKAEMEVKPSDELPGAPLDPRFKFDTFVVGKPNELAHAAARRVGEGEVVSFNPLFLYGGVGLGKTHLMHAIAWELQNRRPDLNVVYLSAEQFMYRFVQALRERKMMDFKQLFRSVDVLMVDDVQFIAGKDSTQEEFFHTFNALVDQNKQIIISADRAPGEIKDLEERIKSRLQCGLVVDLHPTDYELRLGILQSKVEQYSAQYQDVSFDKNVLEFLALRISTNVRVLEGALTRLFAFASLVGRHITLEVAQDCLADILRASERKITVEEIQRKVSEHYNIRLSDMIGPKRLRTYARPRQIAMYLAKQMTSRSLPEIGRRFGGRDHTTVMHGVKRVEELKVQDGQIAEDLEMLRRALEA
jgi:chromosomal replication initiator protein